MMKKSIFFVVTSFLLFEAAGQASETSPVILDGGKHIESRHDKTLSMAPNFRISAITGSEGNYFVGIIDQASGDAQLVRMGSMFMGYLVESILPDQQEVVIAGENGRFVMYLQGDTTLITPLDAVENEGPVGNGASIGVTYEQFIRDNFEAAGMSSPDEPIPEEYMRPISKEEALQRMAESVGMEVPDDAFEPVSRDEFLQRYDGSLPREE